MVDVFCQINIGVGIKHAPDIYGLRLIIFDLNMQWCFPILIVTICEATSVFLWFCYTEKKVIVLWFVWIPYPDFGWPGNIKKFIDQCNISKNQKKIYQINNVCFILNLNNADPSKLRRNKIVYENMFTIAITYLINLF